MREYFAANDVLEVDTPALAGTAVSDVQIESFAIGSSSISQAPLYLNTSPEFSMKRLLAAGYPDIYSICRVFRDGEAGRRHQPEFTMVEWYRIGMNLKAIIEDTVNLVAAALANRAPTATPRKVSYRDAFLTAIDVDPLVASIDEFAATCDPELRETLADERNDWLDWLFATRVAPTFAADRLTIVTHYPASQAALAQLCPQDDRVADRFEVFLGQVEIANGYVELTDASEQRQRIISDNADRARRGRPVRPIDEQLLAALDSGLPQCAGVAMGMERLQMMHDNTDDIRDVITFAFDL
jgi:lysyl-tRNA synthetase class 2